MSGKTPAIDRPTITPPRCRTESLPVELRETAAVHAAVEALRAAVDQVDDESSPDAAAAAWHAASVVRLFCSTYGGAVAGVRVNEDRSRTPSTGSLSTQVWFTVILPRRV